MHRYAYWASSSMKSGSTCRVKLTCLQLLNDTILTLDLYFCMTSSYIFSVIQCDLSSSHRKHVSKYIIYFSLFTEELYFHMNDWIISYVIRNVLIAATCKLLNDCNIVTVFYIKYRILSLYSLFHCWNVMDTWRQKRVKTWSSSAAVMTKLWVD